MTDEEKVELMNQLVFQIGDFLASVMETKKLSFSEGEPIVMGALAQSMITVGSTVGLSIEEIREGFVRITNDFAESEKRNGATFLELIRARNKS